MDTDEKLEALEMRIILLETKVAALEAVTPVVAGVSALTGTVRVATSPEHLAALDAAN